MAPEMGDADRDKLGDRARRAMARFGREISADTSLDLLVRKSSPGDEASPSVLDEQLTLVSVLTEALLAYGLPAHRVEEALSRVTSALGVHAQLVSLHTSFMLSLGTGDTQRTRVVRVQPGRSDLEKLSALHELVGRVERHELSAAEAARRVSAITARPARYGAVAMTACHGLSSMAAAALLGATLTEVLWAAPLGVLVGAVASLAEQWRGSQRLLPAAATLVASMAAFALTRMGEPVRPLLLTLAGVVVLLPGLATTMAITELATGNLISGTARLFGAGLTFLLMTFGVALGQRVNPTLIAGGAEVASGESLPIWLALIAPGLAGLSFAVLLRARPRDAPLVVGAGYVATGAAWIGAHTLGAGLGGFLGALAVGVVSHAHARWKDRPVAITLVPGTLLLVPGSMGFLSFSSLLREDVSGAVETLFRMALVTVSIAAGTLVATLMVPPKGAI